MDEDTIADLKQFIAATVTQQTYDLRSDIAGLRDDISGVQQDVSSLKQDVSDLKQDVSSLKQDVKRLDQKIDDLSAHVAQALDASNDATDEQLRNHETRIAALEAQAA